MQNLHADPFHRFPTVRTTDQEEFRHALVSVYGARTLTVSDPTALKTRGNFLQLSDISIGFSACGAPAVVEFDESDFARVQIPLAGSARTTTNRTATVIHGAQYCITSPGRAATLEYGEGFEHLVLRIKTEALTRKLGAMLGAQPRGMIEFDPAACTSTSAVQGLRDLMMFLAGQFDNEPARLSPIMVKEFEQSLIVGLLCASRHPFSRQLQQDPRETGSWHVCRAEEYIEANWDRAVTIEQLAEVTGIGARSLFRAFQRARGYSPMLFAKRIRLQRARDMLRADGLSVTEAAIKCGFSNLGHFANDYRKLFGELPSATLARASRSGSL
jgi:AraC-like DNA-binding protein